MALLPVARTGLIVTAALIAAAVVAPAAAADAGVQIRCGGWTHGHIRASVRIRPGHVLRIRSEDGAGYALEQTLGPPIPLPRASLVKRRVFAFRFARVGVYRFAARAASCRRLTLAVFVQRRVT